jgi:hypothetical protein
MYVLSTNAFLVSLFLKEGKRGLAASSSRFEVLKCVVHMIFRLELRVENVFHFAVLANDVSLATSQDTKVLLNTDFFADSIAFVNNQCLGDVGALGSLFISNTNNNGAGLLERCELLVKSSILLLARWSIISAVEVDNRLLSTDTQLLQLKEHN